MEMLNYPCCNVVARENYKNGMLKSCIFKEKVEINTPCGSLIPKYSFDQTRDKYRPSLCLYENGSIKSIYIEGNNIIHTTYGTYPAELVTFYEDGSINRVFLCYGQISAYWSWQDEASILPQSEITAGNQQNPVNVIGKISCLHFYKSGRLKSITLFVNEQITLMTSVGKVKARIGVSFFEDGTICSLEPVYGTIVETPIGPVFSFNHNAIGIHGDDNSLAFDQKGNLKSVITSRTGIYTEDTEGSPVIIEPQLIRSQLDQDCMEYTTLKIEFQDDAVLIEDALFHKRWQCNNVRKCSTFDMFVKKEE